MRRTCIKAFTVNTNLHKPTLKPTTRCITGRGTKMRASTSGILHSGDSLGDLKYPVPDTRAARNLRFAVVLEGPGRPRGTNICTSSLGSLYVGVLLVVLHLNRRTSRAHKTRVSIGGLLGATSPLTNSRFLCFVLFYAAVFLRQTNLDRKSPRCLR